MLDLNDFDFLLEDRIIKIQEIDKIYNLRDNAYLSFSGGKDSTILHYLLDFALPNNNIPRIFANTGLEYRFTLDFVKSFQLNDDRFIIVNQNLNIKDTLNKYGYPFKSKEHSLRVFEFNRGSNAYYLTKYLTGIDKNGNKTSFSCPKILRYQFSNRGFYNYSNLCCYKLKKDLINNYADSIGKNIVITGMRKSEGGNRSKLNCTIFNKDKLLKFHPLAPLSDNFIESFIHGYNIKLNKLYYDPYNFIRTGCKGCPFNRFLEKDLLILKTLLPIEYKQCELIWAPVYSEYRRIGYRLKNI